MNDRVNVGFKMTRDDYEAARKRAAASGFQGRGFSQWAVNQLVGRRERVNTPRYETISVAQAADQLGCSVSAVYGMIRREVLRATKQPGGMQVSAKSVKSALEKRASRAAGK